MVESENGIEKEEMRIGYIQIVDRMFRKFFDISRKIIAEEPDGAPLKRRQFGGRLLRDRPI